MRIHCFSAGRMNDREARLLFVNQPGETPQGNVDRLMVREDLDKWRQAYDSVHVRADQYRTRLDSLYKTLINGTNNPTNRERLRQEQIVNHTFINFIVPRNLNTTDARNEEIGRHYALGGRDHIMVAPTQNAQTYEKINRDTFRNGPQGNFEATRMQIFFNMERLEVRFRQVEATIADLEQRVQTRYPGTLTETFQEQMQRQRTEAFERQRNATERTDKLQTIQIAEYRNPMTGETTPGYHLLRVPSNVTMRLQNVAGDTQHTPRSGLEIVELSGGQKFYKLSPGLMRVINVNTMRAFFNPPGRVATMEKDDVNNIIFTFERPVERQPDPEPEPEREPEPSFRVSDSLHLMPNGAAGEFVLSAGQQNSRFDEQQIRRGVSISIDGEMVTIPLQNGNPNTSFTHEPSGLVFTRNALGAITVTATREVPDAIPVSFTLRNGREAPQVEERMVTVERLPEPEPEEPKPSFNVSEDILLKPGGESRDFVLTAGQQNSQFNEQQIQGAVDVEVEGRPVPVGISITLESGLVFSRDGAGVITVTADREVPDAVPVTFTLTHGRDDEPQVVQRMVTVGQLARPEWIQEPEVLPEPLISIDPIDPFYTGDSGQFQIMPATEQTAQTIVEFAGQQVGLDGVPVRDVNTGVTVQREPDGRVRAWTDQGVPAHVPITFRGPNEEQPPVEREIFVHGIDVSNNVAVLINDTSAFTIWTTDGANRVLTAPDQTEQTEVFFPDATHLVTARTAAEAALNPGPRGILVWREAGRIRVQGGGREAVAPIIFRHGRQEIQRTITVQGFDFVIPRTAANTDSDQPENPVQSARLDQEQSPNAWF